MKNFFRQNGLLLVLIALLLSVLIGVGSALLGGNTDPLSNVVNTVVPRDRFRFRPASRVTSAMSSQK